MTCRSTYWQIIHALERKKSVQDRVENYETCYRVPFAFLEFKGKFREAVNYLKILSAHAV
jgi:hypothetical protein